MFEKNMRIAYLLDFYGDVLDDHAKSIMKAYYEDDLSLAEIAECEKISRQGVRHVIKKCEEQLEFLECKLGLAAHFSELDKVADALSDVKAQLEQISDPRISTLLNSIEYSIEKIQNKSN